MAAKSQYVKDIFPKPDIWSQPRWDQASFEGRARHFVSVVNPLNLIATNGLLEQSRKIVFDYRLFFSKTGHCLKIILIGTEFLLPT